MKTVPRSIFLHDKEIKLSPNPFTLRLLDILYRNKRLKNKSLKDLDEALNFGQNEVITEPENILDFDGSLVPDGLDIFVLFKKPRLKDNYVASSLKRIRGKLYFCLAISADDETPYNSPINFIRIFNEMHKKSNQYGFLADTNINLEEMLFLNFYYATPARGNMLQHFNKASASLEKLYTKVRSQVIKEAKAFK